MLFIDLALLSRILQHIANFLQLFFVDNLFTIRKLPLTLS